MMFLYIEDLEKVHYNTLIELYPPLHMQIVLIFLLHDIPQIMLHQKITMIVPTPLKKSL